MTGRRPQDVAQSETRFAALINQASVGVAQLALDGRMVLVNPWCCSILGRDAPTLECMRFQDLDQAPPQLDAALRKVLEQDAPEELEHVVQRPDGTATCVRSVISVVHDQQGRAQHLIVIMSDITEHREAQRHLSMMLDELNHRVKNTLATVQAVALQTLSVSSDPERFREAFLSRLSALSQTHNLLASDAWSGVRLRQLVGSQLSPYGGNRFDLEGEDLKLQPRTALALSMALHELTTNAAKYGALCSTNGRVIVSWHVTRVEDGQGCLHLRWHEEGGPEVMEPASTGFGTRLITRGLAHELQARVELSYPPEGVSCCIDLPIDEETRA